MFPTGKIINELPKSRYSFTKAICTENMCQDYEIMCKNEQLIYQVPVSEIVYFPETWKDLRSEEDKNELADL